MATKILLVDRNNCVYLFKNNGEVFINKEFKGMGRLLTPINNLSLRQEAFFTIGQQQYKTGLLKVCMIDD